MAISAAAALAAPEPPWPAWPAPAGLLAHVPTPWQAAAAAALDDPGVPALPSPGSTAPVSVAPVASATTLGTTTAQAASRSALPPVGGMPGRVLQAYRAAQDRLAREQPGCALTWPLLAGIGQVESGHGSVAGAVASADGVVTPRIIGVPLDGRGPVALVPDSDQGRYDGDQNVDRAVGPMQFLPGTWTTYAADGDRDGAADPHDVDDASLAAGRYLCAAAGAPLTQPSSMVRAVFAYNHSTEYVRQVLTVAAAYAGLPPEALGTGLLPSTTVDVAAFPSAAPVASPTPGLAPVAASPVAARPVPVPVAPGPAAPVPGVTSPAGPVTAQPPVPGGPVAPAAAPASPDAAPAGPSALPEPTATAEQTPPVPPSPGDAMPAAEGAGPTAPPPGDSTPSPTP